MTPSYNYSTSSSTSSLFHPSRLSVLQPLQSNTFQSQGKAHNLSQSKGGYSSNSNSSCTSSNLTARRIPSLQTQTQASRLRQPEQLQQQQKKRPHPSSSFSETAAKFDTNTSSKSFTFSSSNQRSSSRVHYPSLDTSKMTIITTTTTAAPQQHRILDESMMDMDISYADKENPIFVQEMELLQEKLFSSTICTNVLGELGDRYGKVRQEEIENIQKLIESSNDEDMKRRASHRYSAGFRRRFNKMESINSHYAVNRMKSPPCTRPSSALGHRPASSHGHRPASSHGQHGHGQPVDQTVQRKVVNRSDANGLQPPTTPGNKREGYPKIESSSKRFKNLTGDFTEIDVDMDKEMEMEVDSPTRSQAEKCRIKDLQLEKIRKQQHQQTEHNFDRDGEMGPPSGPPSRLPSAGSINGDIHGRLVRKKSSMNFGSVRVSSGSSTGTGGGRLSRKSSIPTLAPHKQISRKSSSTSLQRDRSASVNTSLKRDTSTSFNGSLKRDTSTSFNSLLKRDTSTSFNSSLKRDTSTSSITRQLQLEQQQYETATAIAAAVAATSTKEPPTKPLDSSHRIPSYLLPTQSSLKKCKDPEMTLKASTSFNLQHQQSSSSSSSSSQQHSSSDINKRISPSRSCMNLSSYVKPAGAYKSESGGKTLRRKPSSNLSNATGSANGGHGNSKISPIRKSKTTSNIASYTTTASSGMTSSLSSSNIPRLARPESRATNSGSGSRAPWR
ncbi:unnamed protein product [Ambrosiozyma monospora]|uniref:Unnamed protein product n=1 Tax=Ambrosiozyma monospora TaxID=43982 RepID=A0A9W6YSP9_AMBMO|nr:unnamed protein product [Ambrosiozyma monospora]